MKGPYTKDLANFFNPFFYSILSVSATELQDIIDSNLESSPIDSLWLPLFHVLRLKMLVYIKETVSPCFLV